MLLLCRVVKDVTPKKSPFPALLLILTPAFDPAFLCVRVGVKSLWPPLIGTHHNPTPLPSHYKSPARRPTRIRSLSTIGSRQFQYLQIQILSTPVKVEAMFSDWKKLALQVIKEQTDELGSKEVLKIDRVNESEQELYEKAKGYWSTVLTISSATSGFTYFVTTQSLPAFLPGRDRISNTTLERGTTCGLFLGTAFLVSLTAALLSSILLNEVRENALLCPFYDVVVFGKLKLCTAMSCVTGFQINFLGMRYMAEFTIKFWFLFDIPFVFTAFGILCMLLNGVAVIGGIYADEGMYWYFVALGSGIIIFFIVAFICLRRRSKKFMKQFRARGNSVYPNDPRAVPPGGIGPGSRECAEDAFDKGALLHNHAGPDRCKRGSRAPALTLAMLELRVHSTCCWGDAPTCSIWQDQIAKGEQIRALPCTHGFHSSVVRGRMAAHPIPTMPAVQDGHT
ncbi:hypothetical protein M427DRAFT_27754 [Gonapodya prolifera JEL478]|uniref:Uncharacterized protein n=1 Tax=Gonapodya prolifera (strain JEL478) TaxID=1344416 RepID=A0A139AX85_GONPJ|nr:hypothetical protein M427DRAFT_27754 [Gonapodya prolifera JEL478]|eukprot:KXS21361.1 hypothetical protein M427DRAFT_27754 [Gonapodya prolifera JEL478]